MRKSTRTVIKDFILGRDGTFTDFLIALAEYEDDKVYYYPFTTRTHTRIGKFLVDNELIWDNFNQESLDKVKSTLAPTERFKQIEAYFLEKASVKDVIRFMDESFEGTNYKACHEKILKEGKPIDWAWVANNFSKEETRKKIEKMILESGDAQACYEYAYYNKKIANLPLLEETILKSGNELYYEHFLRYVRGVDKKKIDENLQAQAKLSKKVPLAGHKPKSAVIEQDKSFE